jgi:hypothetical protein
MTTPAAAARKATTRPAGAQRTLVGLLGLLSLAAGVTALVLGAGLLGANRANRPILDPLALDMASCWLMRVSGAALGRDGWL